MDYLGLKQPILVGWSMGCGELMKYVEQFGTDGIGGLVLVDGIISDKTSPETFAALSEFMNQLQLDRQKQTDDFVRSMFRKPEPEDYLNRVAGASLQDPVDTAVVLVYNMISVKDLSKAFARMNRPMLYMFEPDSSTQQTADFLKLKLGNRVRLQRFDGDGHALFVDDPEKFNLALEQFIQSLPQ